MLPFYQCKDLTQTTNVTPVLLVSKLIVMELDHGCWIVLNELQYHMRRRMTKDCRRIDA